MNNQNSFLFSTDLSKNTELSLTNLLEEATTIVKYLLQKVANSPDIDTTLQTAFGNNINPDILKESWTAGEVVFPEIEIVNRNDINHANGAFARDTNTIYLAQEFLLANINNLDAVRDVVLEEYGHFVDSQLNDTDTTGDEGAIFSALVQGKELSKRELQQLKNEDDNAVVIIDGESRAIEQNQNFVFNHFQDVSQLNFNQNATQVDNILRLTPNSSSRRGSVFLNTAIPIYESTSFQTEFQIKIYGDRGSRGADGIAFIIQNSNAGIDAVGNNGEALGYGGINNSLAVELDTYQNNYDINDNHISLLKNGNGTEPIASTIPAFDINNGNFINIWVDYNGVDNLINIFAAESNIKPNSPLLSENLDLATIVGEKAFLGLVQQLEMSTIFMT